jgi:hypothetical protein
MSAVNVNRVLLTLIFAVVVWGSGVIPAIVPQAVPTGSKQGTGTKFQTAGTNSGTLGNLLCNDASGAATDSACGSAASSVPFSGITNGTNTTAAMTVGTGGSVLSSGTGTVTSNGIRAYTVATLPGGAATGAMGYVTDGASSSDCTVGSASTKVFCVYNGSAWVAPAGGGGSGTVSSGAIGSLPGTCNSGDLYFPTNSVYTTVLCGASNTHTYWGPFGLLTPTISTGWSWDNQGSSTIDSTNGYEYLSSPKSGTVSISMRYRTAPVTPYTIKALLLHDISGAPPGVSGNKVDSGFGIAFRDGTGKVETLRLASSSGGPGISVDTWASSTSFSANQVIYASTSSNSTVPDVVFRQMSWMEIEDTGTNTNFYWSVDGQHFKLLYTSSRTAFFGSGPTQVGFYAYANGNAVELAPVSWLAQ